MTINVFETETYYLTREELAQYNEYYNERNTMLSLDHAKHIKYYTWTDGNIMNELEKINSIENKNMFKIHIPTSAIAATLPGNIEQYNAIISTVYALPMKIKHHVIEDTTNIEGIIISVNEDQAYDAVITLAAMNIPCNLNEKYTIIF